MQPLVDADILLHEIGWSSQFKDKETGEDILFGWDKTADLLDEKIRGICWDVESDEEPILFLTSSEVVNKHLNNLRRWANEPEIEYVPNFRYEVALTKPYKGTRKNPKPFHFYNLYHYMLAEYKTVISEDGLEADDMMCIEQVKRGDETIICSRDKDLRICPGWHYSWECGGQRAIGPVYTDEVGWLDKHGDKVIGYGLSFFYYQMLVGDTADNIPGLPKWGQAKAFSLLSTLKTKEELHKAVKSAYKETMGEGAKEYFFEQANLLWINQKKGIGFAG